MEGKKEKFNPLYENHISSLFNFINTNTKVITVKLEELFYGEQCKNTIKTALDLSKHSGKLRNLHVFFDFSPDLIVFKYISDIIHTYENKFDYTKFRNYIIGLIATMKNNILNTDSQKDSTLIKIGRSSNIKSINFHVCTYRPDFMRCCWILCIQRILIYKEFPHNYFEEINNLLDQLSQLTNIYIMKILGNKEKYQNDGLVNGQNGEINEKLNINTEVLNKRNSKSQGENKKIVVKISGKKKSKGFFSRMLCH